MVQAAADVRERSTNSCARLLLLPRATVNVNFDYESLEFHHADPEGAFDVLLSADKDSDLS